MILYITEDQTLSDNAKTKSRSINAVSWRVGEWCDAVGLCRATVYKLIAGGKIQSVKNHPGRRGARLITTSPQEYLASLREDAGDVA